MKAIERSSTQVQALLERKFEGLKQLIHLKRLSAVLAAVLALYKVPRVSLTKLGRSIQSTSQKAGIKRVDRLLGNRAVQRESWLYYGAIIGDLIPKDSDERPLILVDWTDINKLWTSLAATVVTEGRGIVILAETHPVKKNNNARVETGFLKKLKKLLPEHCRPVVISDAGFRGPWNRKILDAEWDFVGRLRGTVQLQKCGDETSGVGWQSVKKLWPSATPVATNLGEFRVAKTNPLQCRVVAFAKRKKKRSKKVPAVGKRKKSHIVGAREPWILVTSLGSDYSAEKVKDIYAKRMRIEESFRDLKCVITGWGLDENLSQSAARVNVLLLLSAIAHYSAAIIGWLGEQAGLQFSYQANTERRRRVLSLPHLGRLIIQEARHVADLLRFLGDQGIATLPILTVSSQE